MKTALRYVCAATLLLAAACDNGPTPAANAEPTTTADAAVKTGTADDQLSRFFIWWNEAYKTPGAYTADGFRQWFTEDATLLLEGREIIRGVEGWATHFQKIQAGGGEVEIVVPFKEVFMQGDKIYNYHVIRTRRDGKASCSLAAGHATLVGDKISSIVLVRSSLDPGEDVMDPQCWTN